MEEARRSLQNATKAFVWETKVRKSWVLHTNVMHERTRWGWCGESFVGTPLSEELFLLEEKRIKYKNKRWVQSCLAVCLVLLARPVATESLNQRGFWRL